jgi:multiple sugar transport system permease protein
MFKRELEGRGAFVYLIPALLFVLIAELVPVVYTSYLGFMEWDVINPPKWAGLKNYLRVFSTPDLLNALKNTAVWVAGTIVFSVGLALLLAVMINQVRLKSVFKAIFFIPATLSPTIASIF